MQLPLFLDSSLLFCQDVADDKSLFELLVSTPSLLINFLEKACEDEAWLAVHPLFMHNSLTWLTDKFYHDKLFKSLIDDLSEIMREHYSSIINFLPLNIDLTLKDKIIQVNGFMFGSKSTFLKELLRRECLNKKSNQLFLSSLSYENFEPLYAYITTNTTTYLGLKTHADLIKILDLALEWQLEGLAISCQHYLTKYLNRDTVIDTLFQAHRNSYGVLKIAAIELINQLNWDCYLELRSHEGNEGLAFEFLQFSENAFTLFNQIRQEITHLICAGTLTEEPAFAKVVNQLPKLRCLTISHSQSFSLYLKEIPPTVMELEVASCLWLTNEHLLTLTDLCPALTKLVLTSNNKIDFEGWGILKRWIDLQHLILARCMQIGDEELKIILQAAPQLTKLDLEECLSLSDQGFQAITSNPGLFTELNLAYTALSDSSLIAIAFHCKNLHSINLTQCKYLTDKGLYELVKLAPSLKIINITQCNLTLSTRQNISKLKNYLKIIY